MGAGMPDSVFLLVEDNPTVAYFLLNACKLATCVGSEE
jgi:hypothetical protein